MLRALQWYLTSLMGTAVLGSVNPCRVSALGTVQRVGGPTVALYIQWVEPRLFLPSPTSPVVMVPPQPACPSRHHPPLPQNSASKLPFIMRFCPGGWTDLTATRRLHILIQTANLKRYLPKKTNTRRSFVFKRGGKYSSGAQSL